MLSPDRWQIVERLFHEALTRPPAERGSFIESSCSGDPEIRSELESLLAADVDSRSRASIAPAIAADWSSSASIVGDEVDGYRVIALLGSGGMGEVFLAEDRELGRRVALKLIPAPFVADAARVRRFADEARAASRLNHPNIITVHRVGVFEGRRYIATEHVDGETLRDRIERGSLPPAEAIDIAVQIADALGAAHAAGIVHRDIKPENVMIRRDGYVKVLDFGLAKLTQPGDADVVADGRPITRAGAVLGTVDYMAPEQALVGSVDHRADLYSLSVVLYEMLTGSLPREIRSGVAEGLPPALLEALRHGLASDPALRFQSADEWRAALVDVRRSIDAPPTRPRPRRWIAIAAGVAAAAVAGLVLRFDPAWLGRFGGARPVVTPAPAATTVAVLPFQTVTLDERDQYLGLGITDAVITQLGVLRQLVVRPTESVRAMTGPDLDVTAAGRKLHVDHVLSGLVQRDGDRVRVTVRLVNVSKGAQEWTARIDAHEDDLFSLQDTVSQRVAAALITEMNDVDRRGLAARRPSNPEAYQLYLQGRYNIARAAEAPVEEGIREFSQATALDPQYALAYAGIAAGYRLLGAWLFAQPLADGMARARAAAEQALAIDPSLADAEVVLGAVKFEYDWDARGAGDALRRGVELGPNSSTARRTYGWYLMAMGRYADGLAELERACTLDPTSPLAFELLGEARYVTGEIDRAARAFEIAADLEPSSPRALHRHAWMLEQLGRYDEALAKWQRAYHVMGRDAEAAEAGRLYASGGYDAFVEHRLAQDLAAKQPRSAAYDDIVLRRYDEAIDRLEDGIRQRGSFAPLVGTLPVFRPLHGNPRFAKLLRTIGWNPTGTG